MYYHRILGRIIFDAFDYFILSIIISIYCTAFCRNHFSEEQKMKRLRQDLIIVLQR